MNSGYRTIGETGSLVGQGRRRECYLVPGKKVCVKFYRSPGNLPANTRCGVRIDIALGRRFRRLNINFREWRYHQQLLRDLPAELSALFPEHTEPVFCPGRGWGIQESLILNADGTLPRRILHELAALDNPALARRLYLEAARLYQRLAEQGVCFFDVSNVLVQWTGTGTFRLRIADFEPSCRALLPGLIHVRPYVRCKVRRRARRFLKRMERVLAAKGFPAVPESSLSPDRSLLNRPVFGLYRFLARRVGLI